MAQYQKRRQSAPEPPLDTGTRIVAACDFNPIKAGDPGIVTGMVAPRGFWPLRAMYCCTFAGNLKVVAKPRQIDVLDHGYTLMELETPQFGLNELLRMRMRRMRTG